jgi:hypothetical protein
MASVNAGESFRPDFDMGAISPGRFAEPAAYRRGISEELLAKARAQFNIRPTQWPGQPRR